MVVLIYGVCTGLQSSSQERDKPPNVALQDFSIMIQSAGVGKVSARFGVNAVSFTESQLSSYYPPAGPRHRAPRSEDQCYNIFAHDRLLIFG